MYDPRKVQMIKNVQNLGAFGGSLASTIRDAGYSEKIARNPQRITDRKWFKEQLPDYGKTAKAIHELMDSKCLDHYTFPLSMSDEEIQQVIEDLPGCILRKIKHTVQSTIVYFWRPNDRSKKDAIEIVLKIRGDYAPEKYTYTDPNENKSDEELLADRQEVERALAIRRERLNGSTK
jgi:hypothetical protein